MCQQSILSRFVVDWCPSDGVWLVAGRLEGHCPSFPHRHGRVQWRWWRSPIGRETAACMSEQRLLATPPNHVLKDRYKLSKLIMSIQVLSSNKIPHRSISLRGSVLRATVAKWPNRNGQPYIGFSGLGFQGVSPHLSHGCRPSGPIKGMVGHWSTFLCLQPGLLWKDVNLHQCCLLFTNV